jgi:hypothetical protein
MGGQRLRLALALRLGTQGGFGGEAPAMAGHAQEKDECEETDEEKNATGQRRDEERVAPGCRPVHLILLLIRIT